MVVQCDEKYPAGYSPASFWLEILTEKFADAGKGGGIFLGDVGMHLLNLLDLI